MQGVLFFSIDSKIKLSKVETKYARTPVTFFIPNFCDAPALKGSVDFDADFGAMLA